jgi:transcriptional regulator with XRE-family HTH domain
MRQARVARKESLYEAAARMGMTAARLSAIEHGRVGSNKDEKPE